MMMLFVIVDAVMAGEADFFFSTFHISLRLDLARSSIKAAVAVVVVAAAEVVCAPFIDNHYGGLVNEGEKN